MSMLTSNRVAGIVLFSLAACLPGLTRIGAFEGTDGARVDKAPLQTFATLGRTASGIEVFRTGGDASSDDRGFELCRQRRRSAGAVERFPNLCNGDGVPRDDLKLMIIFLKSPRVMTRTTGPARPRDRFERFRRAWDL